MSAPERIWVDATLAPEVLTGFRTGRPSAFPYAVEYVRADLSPAAVTVRPLEWDVDGRDFPLDDTMHMGKGYDWDSYELFRQEAKGLGCGYIIWPDHIGSKIFSLYGIADGLYVQNLDGEEAAKAAAQADYERRILSALSPTPGNTNPLRGTHKKTSEESAAYIAGRADAQVLCNLFFAGTGTKAPNLMGNTEQAGNPVAEALEAVSQELIQRHNIYADNGQSLKAMGFDEANDVVQAALRSLAQEQSS